MKDIVCFHLLNDYSGSPKVLREVLDEMLRKGYHVDLITSRGGVLDTLRADNNRLKKITYNYRFSENKIITFLRYGGIQIYTFFLAFRYLFKKDVVFYINTLLPAGPALAGRIMGKRVIYHYHENAFAKGFSYKCLSWTMQRLASKIICVSHYQQGFLKRRKDVVVIPNTLPQSFCDAFDGIEARTLPDKKTVLMLASLKPYKGLSEFIRLAQNMPQYTFQLVINDTSENIRLFLSGCSLPRNLEIFDRQDNVIPFYQEASLVLNLSDKNQAVETFGLTALEAMTAALPVIVPTVGGIAEMVEDGVNGYKIDVRDMDEIERCIEKIFLNNDLYHSLSYHAKRYAGLFNINESGKRIASLFN